MPCFDATFIRMVLSCSPVMDAAISRRQIPVLRLAWRPPKNPAIVVSPGLAKHQRQNEQRRIAAVARDNDQRRHAIGAGNIVVPQHDPLEALVGSHQRIVGFELAPRGLRSVEAVIDVNARNLRRFCERLRPQWQAAREILFELRRSSDRHMWKINQARPAVWQTNINKRFVGPVGIAGIQSWNISAGRYSARALTRCISAAPRTCCGRYFGGIGAILALNRICPPWCDPLRPERKMGPQPRFLDALLSLSAPPPHRHHLAGRTGAAV